MEKDNKVNKFATKGRTKLISGSILQPELAGLRFILVPCSEAGKPDTALHMLLNKKWQKVGQELKGWFSHHIDFKLGSINALAVQSDTWIINALCYNEKGELNEKALDSCLKKVSELALFEKASVHVSTLSAETIPVLQDMLNSWLLDKGVHCYFYQEASAVKSVPAEIAAVKEETKEEVVAVKATVKKPTKPAKRKPSFKKAVPVEVVEATDIDDTND